MELIKKWLVAIGSIVAFAASVVTVVQWWTQPAPPNFEPILINQPANSFPALEIREAVLTTRVRENPFLIFFSWGTDNFYEVNMVVENRANLPMQGCQLQTDYSGPKIKGEGGLFEGNWTDWYGKGANPFFNISADSNSAIGSFSFPKAELYELTNMSVRIVCEEPTRQISPWKSVDLSAANWPN